MEIVYSETQIWRLAELGKLSLPPGRVWWDYLNLVLPSEAVKLIQTMSGLSTALGYWPTESGRGISESRIVSNGALYSPGTLDQTTRVWFGELEYQFDEIDFSP